MVTECDTPDDIRDFQPHHTKDASKPGSIWNDMDKEELSLSRDDASLLCFLLQGTERNGMVTTPGPALVVVLWESSVHHSHHSTADISLQLVKYTCNEKQEQSERWSPEKTNDWMQAQPKKGHCLKSTMLPSAPTTQPAVWCFACGLYGDPFYATPAPDTPVPSTRIYTHDTGHIPFPYDPSCFQIFPLAVLSFNLFAYSSGSSIPLR